jgi:hypothetical protein
METAAVIKTMVQGEKIIDWWPVYWCEVRRQQANGVLARASSQRGRGEGEGASCSPHHGSGKLLAVSHVAVGAHEAKEQRTNLKRARLAPSPIPLPRGKDARERTPCEPIFGTRFTRYIDCKAPHDPAGRAV